MDILTKCEPCSYTIVVLKCRNILISNRTWTVYSSNMVHSHVHLVLTFHFNLSGNSVVYWAWQKSPPWCFLRKRERETKKENKKEKERKRLVRTNCLHWAMAAFPTTNVFLWRHFEIKTKYLVRSTNTSSGMEDIDPCCVVKLDFQNDSWSFCSCGCALPREYDHTRKLRFLWYHREQMLEKALQKE